MTGNWGSIQYLGHSTGGFRRVILPDRHWVRPTVGPTAGRSVDSRRGIIHTCRFRRLGVLLALALARSRGGRPTRAHEFLHCTANPSKPRVGLFTQPPPPQPSTPTSSPATNDALVHLKVEPTGGAAAGEFLDTRHELRKARPLKNRQSFTRGGCHFVVHATEPEDAPAMYLL